MKIRLGYLGMPHTLLETYHTITYQKYLKLKDKRYERLEDIILSNLKTLNKVIDYNIKNKINFYRITHNLFPLATIEDIDFDYFIFQDICQRIGNKIKKYNIRIDAHPDHFCVLSTTKEEVLENSIRIIKHHYDIFKMLDISGKIVLHIGSKMPSKEEATNRFIHNFNNLDDSLKKLIILENDDHLYTVTETLIICEKLNIPMVLDYHHFKCYHDRNEKLESLLPRIIATWKNEILPPKMHFSSPKNKKEKRTHHFYLDYHSFLQFINILKKQKLDIDIMLESKGKDEALFKLLRQLHFYKPVKIKKNEIIIDD